MISAVIFTRHLILVVCLLVSNLSSGETNSSVANQYDDLLFAAEANKNATLIEMRREVASNLTILMETKQYADALQHRIKADFSDTRTSLDKTGLLNSGIGKLLLQHRESLPDTRTLASSSQRHAQAIAAVAVRRMLHREEARSLTDLTRAVSTLEQQLEKEITSEAREQLHELLSQRRSLLGKLLAETKHYLERLQETHDLEEQLIVDVMEYNDFLNQRLWWIQASEPTGIQELLSFPGELKQLTARTLSAVYLTSQREQIYYSPVLLVAALVAFFLLWNRDSISQAIRDSGKNVGRVKLDRISCTLRALLFSFLGAAPLPLVLLATAWLLVDLPIGNDQSQGPNISVLRIALLTYVLLLFCWICISKGLAESHFRWEATAVERIHTTLRRLIWIFVPAALIISLAYTQSPSNTGGIVAKIGILVFQSALAVMLYRLLHPRQGILAPWIRRDAKSLPTRVYPIVFWFIVLFPPWLALEALAGYGHSALAMSLMYLNTLGFLAALVVVYFVARRWLLVVHRRLAYDAAIERRKSILAAREAKAAAEDTQTGRELELDEPVVNLTELSDDTRSMVLIAIIVLGFIGLFFLWSPVFPALRIFDTIDLWYQDVTIDGETRRLPTTVADIGLAVVFLLGTIVVVRRLPSVIEIVLLQRSSLSESDRYTVVKLLTYTLVAIGVVLALGALGATWSQIQWLVAALGVGIGFGLQEIVANFICGLIILFERPIRIGDVVTVGDTSGIVTKIRIRATTIRTWDRQELLVPNKDLITGRVLNWSLSDEMTRVVITVGVEYGTNVKQALSLMKEAASEHEHALDDPAPIVSLENFDDNALSLTLRVYISEINYRIKTTSDIRAAINQKFNEAGIVIAYPQRDVHVDSKNPLRVSFDPPRTEACDFEHQT